MFFEQLNELSNPDRVALSDTITGKYFKVVVISILKSTNNGSAG